MGVCIRHFVLVSGAIIVCSFHFWLTSLHIRLEDITRSITIVTLAPYCLPTPPFQVSFTTVQWSLRSDAPPQNPLCSLPTLVDAAHTWRGLPSVNIDGFCTLLVSLIYYCSLFLAILLFFFWHPQFLTSWLPPVLSPFVFYVSFHPLPLTCSPSLLCAPACAFTYTLIQWSRTATCRLLISGLYKYPVLIWLEYHLVPCVSPSHLFVCGVPSPLVLSSSTFRHWLRSRRADQLKLSKNSNFSTSCLLASICLGPLIIIKSPHIYHVARPFLD